ncbi:ABC transporter ATP-binding protein [Bordetella petrii]|nr:ABC transporter ATP-binding protein [Bordetella petrii]
MKKQDRRDDKKLDSIAGAFRLLYGQLSTRRKWQFWGLLVLMLLGSMAEMASLGMIVPFLGAVMGANGAFCGDGAGRIFCDMSFTTLSLIFVGVAVVSTVIRTLLAWVNYKFSYALGADIGAEIYRRILHQPYAYHVSLNTSEAIASMNKANTVVSGVIAPLVLGVTSLVVVVAIVAVLMHIDATAAIAAMMFFGGLYLFTTYLVRRRLRENGRLISRSEGLRVRSVQEGLGGIRDVLLDGSQSLFISRFISVNTTQRLALASNAFLGVVPRYVIESVGIALLVGMAWWGTKNGEGVASQVPVLGALAFGAQKLLPRMQQLYTSWAQVSGNRAVLTDIIALLKLPMPIRLKGARDNDPHVAQNDASGVVLRNVSFRYRPDGPDVLKGIDLHIPRGSRVGVIGKTGSGKSTLMDLIMGLLEPSSGAIVVDGRNLDSRSRRAWQERLAHVPQAIYLADASIAENIAFGALPDQVDRARVKQAATRAQLDQYVATLPDGYDTVVGERGVRLSGGQRQRIGIARALYKQADIIVFDEATSALDTGTESMVMESIEALGRDVTILMIAHRLTTLRACDRVVELADGKVRRVGSYAEIVGTEGQL